MSPYSRTMWTLILALLLWSPVALQAIGGQIDGDTAGLYFLGALVLAYIGIGGIDMIAGNYRRTAQQVEQTKMRIEIMERRSEEEQRRRATDKKAPEEPDKGSERRRYDDDDDDPID